MLQRPAVKMLAVVSVSLAGMDCRGSRAIPARSCGTKILCQTSDACAARNLPLVLRICSLHSECDFCLLTVPSEVNSAKGNVQPVRCVALHRRKTMMTAGTVLPVIFFVASISSLSEIGGLCRMSQTTKGGGPSISDWSQEPGATTPSLRAKHCKFGGPGKCQ